MNNNSSQEDQKIELEHIQHISEIQNKNNVNSDMPLDPVLSKFHDMPRWTFIRKFWRLFTIGMLVNLSAVYTGYTLAAPGNIVANAGFIAQFGTIVNPTTGVKSLDATYVSLWGAIVYAAQVVSQLLSPITADRYGLKCNMYLLTVLMALAIVVEIVATEWTHFLAAKILSGLSSGILGTSVLAYVSEITTPQMRGIHLAAFSLFNAIGQFLVAIALEVLQQTAPLAYKRIFYSEFAVLAVWLPVCILLPESPVFLCKKNRVDKAKKSLRQLVGPIHDFDIDHEYAVLDFQVKESAAMTHKSSKSDWIAAFKGTNLRRTIISTIPYNFQILVGSPLVFGYTTYFFQLAGLENAFQASLIVYCVLLFGILVSFYMIDKAGRRPLLIYGGGVMMVACMIIGGLGVKGTSSGGATANALIAISCIWVFAYAISVAPLGYSSLVEVSTPQLRSVTAGLASGFYACINTAFFYIVPILLSDQQAGWGIKTGFFFGGLAFCGLLLVWFMFPETKDRSYPELDELFERKVPAWKFATTRTSYQDEQDQRGDI